MLIGDDIPSARVAILDNDLPVSFDVQDLLVGHRCLIIGAPQAFTPLCSNVHIPGILDDLDKYEALGFDQFIVIAPDNPWVMAAWQRHFPDAEKFVFLSDGNRAFIRACGLMEKMEGLFLGECSKRYIIRTTGVHVEGITIESSPLEVTTTASKAQLDALMEIEAEDVLEFVEEEDGLVA